MKIFNPRTIFAIISSIVIILVFALFGIIFYTAYPAFLLSGPGFITGTVWSYQTHQYGILYLIMGTMFLTILTLLMAGPLGILTALFISEWAKGLLGKTLRTLIELLVGIPSVVYGIFGFLILSNYFNTQVNPFVDSTLGFIPLFRNVTNSGSNFLLAAVILTIMILPTIMALSLESMRSVPSDYREASFALGADKWDTIRHIILPVAWPGILTSIILGIMRAMGETMAVVMVLDQSLHLPRSILDSGSIMTAKIVNDAGYYLMEPESRAALYGIAAVLLVMEICFVAVFRVISSRFGVRN